MQLVQIGGIFKVDAHNCTDFKSHENIYKLSAKFQKLLPRLQYKYKFLTSLAKLYTEYSF